VASLVSRLVPVIVALRGEKRMFLSPERTLAEVARRGASPARSEPPARLSRTHRVERADINGWPVYTIGPRDGVTTATVFYLHGGCYVFEIDPVHWSFIAKLVDEAGVSIVVPIMPLAPTGTASTTVPAVADLVAARIAEVGLDRVSIVGDSAGGGMALAVAMELRDRALAPLHATVLISPWLDISGTDPQLAVLAPRDPWLAVPGTRAAGALYRGELPDDDWRVSPLNGSLDRLGPVTMFSGTRDILNADAERFAARAAAAGLNLNYLVGAGMLHVYPILPMPEGDAARAIVAAAVA
jgi:monoterpene epsilon-lactone hydrolase